METKEYKCSNLEHKYQKVFKYCGECNKFMCHQCYNYHIKLFNNSHHITDITEEKKELFTGFCEEENHNNKLEYFCKTHNVLCCSSCIEKNSEKAKHKNCEFIKIDSIKEEKNNILEKNFNMLEELSKNIKERVDNIKNYAEKNEEIKENIKSKILKTITIIRNKLNEREDELLSELDIFFSQLCPDEKEIKIFEKIPKKIKELLSKRNEITNKLNDNFLLNSFINDCINIEKEIQNINELNDKIKKYDINSEVKLFFYPQETEKDLTIIYNNIKFFGKLYQQESDLKNFFVIESEKEKNELQNKINELKEEIDNLKQKIEQKEKEYDKLMSNLNSVKYDLDSEKDENRNLRNKLNNFPKIKFTMRSRCALHKCLDCKDLGYNRSPHLWDYGHHNNNQIFEFERNYDGTYSIKNSASGLYLGIEGDRIAFRHKNENAQSFNLHHFGDGYYLFQEKGGGVIDLYGPQTHNGATIGKYSRNNGNNQQWKLVVHI